LIIHGLGGLDGVLAWDGSAMVQEWLFLFVGPSLDGRGSAESILSLDIDVLLNHYCGWCYYFFRLFVYN